MRWSKRRSENDPTRQERTPDARSLGAVSLVVVGGLVVALAWVIVVGLPGWVYPALDPNQIGAEGVTGKDKYEVQNARLELQAGLRTTLVQALAGLAAVSGALHAWRQSQRQAEEKREDSQVQLFGSALGYLASESDSVRASGIHYLARLAERSPDHRHAVVEVLTAFVREHTVPKLKTEEEVHELCRRGQRGDIQTAVLVAGRLTSRWPEATGPLILPGAELTGIRLEEGVSLTGADLRNARWYGAHLDDVDLRNAKLQGTDLRDAHLRRARLQGAHLSDGSSDGDADLGGAHFEGAKVAGAVVSEQMRHGAWTIAARGVEELKIASPPH
jgi:hypothetical protein